MTARVLILSPDTGFGGLIQQTLEKAGGYEPVLVTSGRQAMDYARQARFDLAILDADIVDVPADQLGSELLTLDPELRLILIPPETPSPGFFSHESNVSGYLTKPFYLPDLVEIVDRSLSSEPSPVLATTELVVTEFDMDVDEGKEPYQQAGIPDLPAPLQHHLPWLEDVTRAAQLLAKLSMASDAQAGLLLKDFQLWAYAGQLPEPAVQELAQMVRQVWKSNPNDVETGESQMDLARYIRLKSTDGEYMLYATMLENQMLLVLAFNAKMSFSQVRSQAVSLARALNSPPEERSQQNIPEDSSQNEADETSWLFASKLGEEQQPEVEKDVPDVAATDAAPSPAEIQDTRWIYEFAEDAEGNMGEEKDPGEDISSVSEESRPRQPESEGAPLPASLAFHSPVVSDLHCACVLVPRLPEHRLSGDLAQLLEGWMSRLALAYAWRLEFIDVCPTHLQWVAGVAPENSADQLIQQVRTRTSEMIFRDFPRLGLDNPSGDFWAPGYLAVSSRMPLPGEVVGKFIRHTRLRQGVTGEY
jgi:CheY-like chemotaxis protein/REP element-mobilizing transposase RayT